MLDILQREFIYLWFFASVQFEQIFKYYALGIILGSAISVFGKQKIYKLFTALQNKKMGAFGVIPASIIGIASPLCMYGTIPIAASFSEKGMRDDWLAAFMMSSILLNPQLIIYSAALGTTALTIRIISCFLCGIAAGLLIRFFYTNKNKDYFKFSSFGESSNRDTDPNLILRLLKNIWRNIKATGMWFILGILLSSMFQRYVPAETFAGLFGAQNKGFGLLLAATLGVPLYVCGGATIPLLQQWLASGMSMGAATSFMIAGPAAKITNISALKIIRRQAFYFIYFIQHNFRSFIRYIG
jgi:uncharacterized membrane protein YraQ (UPF0718 family)